MNFRRRYERFQRAQAGLTETSRQLVRSLLCKFDPSKFERGRLGGDDSEAEVECWKPGRSVSRVSLSLRFIVRRGSRGSRNGTPFSPTMTDLITSRRKRKRAKRRVYRRFGGGSHFVTLYLTPTARRNANVCFPRIPIS